MLKPNCCFGDVMFCAPAGEAQSAITPAGTSPAVRRRRAVVVNPSMHSPWVPSLRRKAGARRGMVPFVGIEVQRDAEADRWRSGRGVWSGTGVELTLSGVNADLRGCGGSTRTASEAFT